MRETIESIHKLQSSFQNSEYRSKSAFYSFWNIHKISDEKFCVCWFQNYSKFAIISKIMGDIWRWSQKVTCWLYCVFLRLCWFWMDTKTLWRLIERFYLLNNGVFIGRFSLLNNNGLRKYTKFFNFFPNQELLDFQWVRVVCQSTNCFS